MNYRIDSHGLDTSENFIIPPPCKLWLLIWNMAFSKRWIIWKSTEKIPRVALKIAATQQPCSEKPRSSSKALRCVNATGVITLGYQTDLKDKNCSNK